MRKVKWFYGIISKNISVSRFVAILCVAIAYDMFSFAVADEQHCSTIEISTRYFSIQEWIQFLALTLMTVAVWLRPVLGIMRDTWGTTE